MPVQCPGVVVFSCDAETPVERAEAAEVRAARRRAPGTARVTISACVSGATSVGSSSSRPSASTSSRHACIPAPDGPRDRGRSRAARTRRRARSRRTASRPVRRRARRGRRSPRSSRSAGGPGGAIGTVPSNGSPDACASRWRTVEPGGPAGSSRSTTPSSAATSVASALTGFETEASRTDATRVPTGRDGARRRGSLRPRRTGRPSRRSGAVPPRARDTTRAWIAA